MDIAATSHTHHEPQSFWRRYIFSTDHKVIGIQYYLTAFVMALVSGMLAVIIRLQLAYPEMSMKFLTPIFPNWVPEGVLTPEFYIAIVTMHGTLMVFFVISFALVSGFGNYLIPLQIGARDMAFPFLNMLSYWFIVPASIIMLASFFVEGGAAASGWTAYPPLSGVQSAVPGSGLGQTLWILGMALFIVSFTMGGLNFVTTVLELRASGMSMMRLPMTVWTMFVAAVLALLAFPALTSAAIMLLFDRHFATSFFLPTEMVVAGELQPHQGGTPLLFQHLFWFLGHPEVYVLLLPALGVTFDIIPAFTRKPIFGYRISVYSILVIAVLSIIVWGHHMFVSGMNPYLGEFFTIGTLLITLPSAVIGMNLIASLWGGSLRLTTPMLFAIGVIALFGTGGLGGIFLGTATSDIYFHDSYFVVGHFHFMIGGVTLFAIFAATYYWFPKMFGRMMNERWGKAHFWLSLISFYGMFMGMHFLGLGGAPRRYYAFTDYAFLQPLQDLQVLVTISSLVFAASQLIFIANFVWSLFKGQKADANCWKATTLEWSAPSPPPHGNWGDALPNVHRWAYEYNLPGHENDYVPQTVGSAKEDVSTS